MSALVMLPNSLDALVLGTGFGLEHYFGRRFVLEHLLVSLSVQIYKYYNGFLDIFDIVCIHIGTYDMELYVSFRLSLQAKIGGH